MTKKNQKVTRKESSESPQLCSLQLQPAVQDQMIAARGLLDAARIGIGLQQLRFRSRRLGQSLTIRTFCSLTLLFAVTAFSAFSVSARNQDRKGDAALRTIHGIVVDKSENPAPSSVVYLLNVKTQAVKTYIADDAGAYRFSGLDPNVDYEVHAERNDMTSSNRTVSSFDSRHDIEVTLKLSRKKTPR